MYKNTHHELTRILKNEIHGLENCLLTLSLPSHLEQFEKAIAFFYQTIQQKGKIILTGVGKSGNIATKIAATLNSSGSPSVFLHPTDALHGDSGFIQPTDALWFLSYTGNTKELLTFIDTLQQHHPQLPRIGMGKNPHSSVAKKCDAWIQISILSEACPYGLVPTTSTTTMLAVADAIALILMQKNNFQPKDFARFHPKGSLGKRLTMPVRHLMIPYEKCALLFPDTHFKKIITLSSEKKQGAVLIITKEDQLIGIITDGDIRRGLLKHPDPSGLTAQDLMTKQPLCVEDHTVLDEALKIMEKKNAEISVLPIVNKENKCLGLIRLHDIVKEI